MRIIRLRVIIKVKMPHHKSIHNKPKLTNFASLIIKEWRRWNSIWLPPVRFSQKSFFKEESKSFLCVIFNILVNYTFPGNLIEIPNVVLKVWILFYSVLTIFIIVLDFFYMLLVTNMLKYIFICLFIKTFFYRCYRK